MSRACRLAATAAVAAAVVLMVAGCSGDKYTYDEYYRIEDGMGLQEVEDVLGGKGEAQPQTEFQQENRFVEYRWVNPDESYVYGHFDTDDLTIGGRGVYDFDDQMTE